VQCAACAKNVFTFTLRSPSSWQYSRPSKPSMHSTQQRANTTTNNDVLTKQCPSVSPNPPCSCDNVSFLAACKQACAHHQRHSSTPGTTHTLTQGISHPFSSHVGHSDDSTDAAEGMDDALHDAQQLFKAAERIIKESCTEKWLLQPYIPDMERNEYRCQTTTTLACFFCPPSFNNYHRFHGFPWRQTCMRFSREAPPPNLALFTMTFQQQDCMCIM